MQKALIYCPKCKWEPPRRALWECLEVCGCLFDTFETGGVCPECHEKFEHTQCINCGQFSPHSEWYHYPKKAPTRKESETEDEVDQGVRVLEI